MQSRLPLDQIRTRFDEPLFVVGGTAVTVASVISFVVFLLAAYAASWLLRRSMRRYAVVALGAFVALDNLGVSITALAGVGAILAVGIGFGLQNIAQNFASGLILLLERPVKKGDFVEVGGRARHRARHPRPRHRGHHAGQRRQLFALAEALERMDGHRD